MNAAQPSLIAAPRLFSGDPHCLRKGTKIPEEIKDTILGETGNTTVRAADKYVKQEDRKIIPFGVVDSGNSFPDELVESVSLSTSSPLHRFP